ncbi:unnamed protein product [Calypogeia fissa]
MICRQGTLWTGGVETRAVSAILTAAQNKLGDIEMDWYGTLQVNAGADDSLIESQYRRLAQLLQADKALGTSGVRKVPAELRNKFAPLEEVPPAL